MNKAKNGLPSDAATESGSVFESLSAPQSEDALVTDVASSDDVQVESSKGDSSSVDDQTSFLSPKIR